MARQQTHIAMALRKARHASGMSQEELAERAGLSRFTIAGIETSRHRNVTTETLVKIAKALNITPQDLLNPEDSGLAKLVEEFMDTQIGRDLALTPDQKKWLSTLLGAWPPLPLTHLCLLHLAEAIRLSRPS